jgi:hypothetical protein
VPDRELVDGDQYRSNPQSEDDLVHDLAEIDARASKDAQPLIATLYYDAEPDDTPFLSIGLGARDSVLVYSSGLRNEEGGISRGPRTGDTTEFPFRYGTVTNYYLGSSLIPKETAFEAAREFFRTGQRPTCVEWEDA